MLSACIRWMVSRAQGDTMRIILSRKGFDSAAGGAPSPIVNGEPISLPIPTTKRSETTYELAGLGDIVAQTTKGRIQPENLCHEDPMFHDGRCAFGQTGAAQAHLEKQGVGVGDVFLFFGLFAGHDGRDRHHRIFGFLRVEENRALGERPHEGDGPKGFPRRHPHTIGEWNENNTIYLGQGAKAKKAHESLRLSKPGGVVSCWLIPPWFRTVGLSYHRMPNRWIVEGELKVVGRGQEFVADIGDFPEPQAWLEAILRAIKC
jgi:Nucleotide modification associated domain 3